MWQKENSEDNIISLNAIYLWYWHLYALSNIFDRMYSSYLIKRYDIFFMIHVTQIWYINFFLIHIMKFNSNGITANLRRKIHGGISIFTWLQNTAYIYRIFTSRKFYAVRSIKRHKLRTSTSMMSSIDTFAWKFLEWL